ncbi:YhjD/YihY/BrkB family envelope integrity protein [Aeromicrobium sp. IC_218]|uniref:YhjD/YihY/BrkB family envelope integrity protein n=1 Tax=Aeromicrobium sp. IC_218 TaxID=2545468 RepID=UPI00103A7799|nr:YhjD/YihY/BrkB family envelope integrity protein [Aeromicrobium sp. IC_218]TCI97638.1 ribonuclease BN [Aeromicrobium sp. IC_218]
MAADPLRDEHPEPLLGTRRVDELLARLPARARRPVDWLLSRWVGRTLLRTTVACVRVEIFDRSMTIAAQFFTSVLPLLIVTATLVASGSSDAVSDLVGASDSSGELIDQAVDGSGDAAFGAVGVLLVLVSATSLSRALTRAFAVIWQVARPQVGLRSAWRWLAVVLVMVLAVVVTQNLAQQVRLLPPPVVWPAALSLATDVAVTLFVPWVLLSGQVAARVLLPAAVCFGVVMLGLRPAADAWLPWALEVSSDRYGPIGMAFTYLAWLYVVSFVLLATAVLGRVLAGDEGRLGSWIRGGADRDAPGGSD